MTVALALAASLLWGGSDFTGGLATKGANYLAITFWRVAMELVLLFVFLVFVPGHPHMRDMLLGACAGVAATIVLPMFYKALGDGRMGVVAPVAGTTAASVPVAVGLLSGERPSVQQLIGITLALVAIFFVSFGSDDPHRTTKLTVSKDVQSGVVSGIGFGTYFALLHHTSKDSSLWPSVGVVVVMLILLAVGMRILRVPIGSPRVNLSINALGAVCDFGGGATFLYATRSGLLSVTGVLSSFYPVGTTVLAWLLLKERFGRLHIVGLLATAVSLGLIGSG